MKALLSVKDLRVNFYTSAGIVKAVDGISFEIAKKEIFALVGESGCGKSTTALAIMRLVPYPGKIVGGKILFKNKNLLEATGEEMTQIRGKEISMIFQNPLTSLNPVYRVGHQVAEAIVLDNIPKRKAWKKVIELFKNVKIPDAEERAYSYPHELSGGMRQRVMIGMMISREPSLIIADEPTTALDVTIQAQIIKLLSELRDTLETSILLITHDFGVVAELADRIAVMYAGKIVEMGNVYQIFENPLHPYTGMLIDALPRITKKEGRLEEIPGSVPNLINPPSGCRFHPRCPLKKEVCSTEEPSLVEVERGHFVACHLYGGGKA
ncbi:ABC transporter ATP-binding protein [Thermococcus sp.]